MRPAFVNLGNLRGPPAHKGPDLVKDKQRNNKDEAIVNYAHGDTKLK
jgi:hypothetical protein